MKRRSTRSKLEFNCRAQVKELLRNVQLPNPWSMNNFIDQLETYRQREIDLCAFLWTPGSATGAWHPYATHDVIAYAENTTPAHQDHTIFHEVGHMLAGHAPRCVLSTTEAEGAAPHLRPAALNHLLAAESHALDEYEAELIATILLAQVAKIRPHGPLQRRVEAVFQ